MDSTCASLQNCVKKHEENSQKTKLECCKPSKQNHLSLGPAAFKVVTYPVAKSEAGLIQHPERTIQ